MIKDIVPKAWAEARRNTAHRAIEQPKLRKGRKSNLRPLEFLRVDISV
jgi:hypothetical protein